MYFDVTIKNWYKAPNNGDPGYVKGHRGPA